MNDSRPARYDEDFVAWSREQARLVREGQLDTLDHENVAEELDGLARAEKNEVRRRLIILLIDLLKQRIWRKQVSASRQSSIIGQRDQIAYVVEASPCLRREIPEMIVAAYATARKMAAVETGRAVMNLPAEPPFSNEDIFGDDLPRIFPSRRD